MMYLIVAAGSFLVGLSIGWCGIAGFLLPILFMGYCGLESNEALLISFLCFAISGAIGAVNYGRQGELPIRQGLVLGISSLFGSTIGAMLGQFFAGEHMKTILYVVVLVSGCAIFLQELLLKRIQTAEADRFGEDNKDIPSYILIPIGMVTAVLCALSGAGGPVLVMPVLVLLGMGVKAAIGTALFDSLFIALPAVVVFGTKANLNGIALLLAIALISHGLGIQLGSRTEAMIPQRPLKRVVAIGSIAFACFKLFF